MEEDLGCATMALPNGYCGLPLQQTCPHANACLTCPVFITTPDFLAEHLAQLRNTKELTITAKAKGHTRLVEMNQRVATNLEDIIDTIQQPDTAGNRYVGLVLAHAALNSSQDQTTHIHDLGMTPPIAVDHKGLKSLHTASIHRATGMRVIRSDRHTDVAPSTCANWAVVGALSEGVAACVSDA